MYSKINELDSETKFGSRPFDKIVNSGQVSFLVKCGGWGDDGCSKNNFEQ